MLIALDLHQLGSIGITSIPLPEQLWGRHEQIQGIEKFDHDPQTATISRAEAYQMTRMTQQEKEQFLAGLHVGVLAIPNGAQAPLTVPVWYDYTPGGDLWFLTGPTSRKGRLLKQGVHISLCAQTETPPYKYVSIDGPVVSIAPSDKEKYGRPMAHRYLGQKLGDQYTDSGDDTESSVIVRVRPERWLAVDYGKR